MLRYIKCTIIVLLLLSALPASAATWYVNCSDGNAKNQVGYGTSEAYPWKNITYAATMSAVGDTVLVYPGTYNTATGEIFTTTINITGKYFKSTTTSLATIDAAASSAHALTLGNNATLEGFTIKRSGTTNTIYCVNITGSNVQLLNNIISQTGTSGNYIRAVYITSTGDNVLLSGNTISALRGETVYFESGADDPIIRNNIINNTTAVPNTSYGHAYGIRLYGSANTQIMNNIINANVGLAQEGSCTNSLIRGNKFISYTTDTNAWAGIYLQGYGEITSNEVRGYGSSTNAGIHCYSGGPFTLNKNTVVACLYGIRLAVDATLKNNIIAAAPGPHKLYDLSAGIYQTAGRVTSTYNDVYNNATNYYGTILDRSNDITTYPRFINADNNDYRIWSDSPCAGTADDRGNRGAYETLGGSSGVLTVSYVKSTGDDTKSGTNEANAWQTLRKAISSTEGTVNVVAGSSWTLALADLPLYLGDRQKLVLYGTGQATIDATDAAQHTLVMGNNTTVEGLTIKKSTTTNSIYGIYVIGGNAQILNNVISQTGASGYYIRGVHLTPTADNCLIQGNTISALRGETVYLESGADNPVIRNNTITNSMNTAGPHSTYGYGYGIRQFGSANSLIEGNTINANGGIAQEGSCANSIIRGNRIIGYTTSYALTYAYFGMYLQGYGEITSNEVRSYRYSTNAGIQCGTGGPFTLNKNTVVDCIYGIRSAVDATLKNNIIAAAPGPHKLYDLSAGVYQTAGKVTSTYNDIYNNETTYFGTILNKSNDITTYPRFVSTDNNDYRIYSDSPCAGTADDGGNRGAYETVAGSSGVLTVSYVKSSGDDTKSGTNEANAWQTLKKAISSTEGTVNVVAGSSWTLALADLPLYLGNGQKLALYGTGQATIDSTTAAAYTFVMGDNTTIEGLTIKKSAIIDSTYGIYVLGANAQLLNNTISQTGASGYYIRGVHLTPTADNCLIQGNTISALRGETVYLESGADNPVIRNNTITNSMNTAGPHSTYGYGYGIRFANLCTNPLIEGNTINANGGIAQDGSCANSIIRGNKIIGYTTSYALTYAYFGMYLQGYGEITSNEVRSYRYTTNAGIHCGVGGPFTLNKNTVVDCIYGVRLAVDATLKNNIIAAAVKMSGYYDESYGIYQTGGTVTSQSNDLFHNEYDYYGTIYGKTNELNKCPRFVNPDANDYRLYADSPCVGTADDGKNRGAYDPIGSNSGILNNSYVKPSGNDSTGDGTSEATAWKTVTRALSSTEGTVNALAGTYGTGETFPLIITAGQTLKSIADPPNISTLEAISTVNKDVVLMVNGATIEGLSINNASTTTGLYCINQIGARNRIKNNYINFSGSGAASYPINGDATADDGVIEGNTVTTVRRFGLSLIAGATGNIIRNNNISITNAESAQTYAVTIGNGCNNSWLEGNTITNTCNLVSASYYHYGINLDATSTGLTIKSNKIIGAGTTATGRGIYWLGGTGDITSNEVRGFGNFGINVTCASGTVNIFKNTVAKCMFGITGAGAGTKNVKNNIIAGEVGGKPYTSGKGLDNDTANNFFVSTYNLIWANDITYEGTVYDKTGDITTKDAVFVDATNDDFHLQAGSPAIDSGTPAGVDRGCYDYDLPPLTVTVLGPNGGENIPYGTLYNITWEATSYPTAINIHYSGDNGASYSDLALGETNDGVYPWYVNKDPTTQAKIKIEALQNGSIATDESNTVFTIQPITYYVNCATGVNSANGGRGTSEALPWKNITYAATMAATGATVNVAAGTYNSTTGETFPISITGRKFLSSVTALATIDSGTANVNTVNIQAGATLEGLTIKGDSASTSVAYYTVYVNGASVSLLNNYIYNDLNNTAGLNTQRAVYVSAAGDNLYLYGNTIYSGTTPFRAVDLASGADFPVLWNNNITCSNGTAGYGFGVYLAGSNAPSIEGNTIVANKAVADATACNNQIIRNNKIMAYSADAAPYYGIAVRGYGLIERNEIRGYINNGADCSAILLPDTSALPFTVNKNNLVNNLYGIRAQSGYGGAVTITNNIISAAPRPGSFMDDSIGIYRESGTVNSRYNTFYNLTNTYSGTVNDKVSDTTACPRFVSVANNDYRLLSDSPCRNTADDGDNRGAYGTVEASSGFLSVSYISGSGSDSNTGTNEANAWRTVTRALSSTEGTVKVMAGTYTAGESFPLILSPGQALQAITYPATIDSGTANTNTINLQNSTTLEGLTVKGDPASTSLAYYTLYVTGANVSLLNNTIYNDLNNTAGLNTQRAVYVSATGDYLYLYGNTIYTGTTPFRTVDLASGADYPVFWNNNITCGNITDGYGYGLFLGGSISISFEGNTVVANKAMGQNAACGDFIFRNNKLTGYSNGVAAKYGLAIRGYGLVERNEVRGYLSTDNAAIHCLAGGPVTINHNTIVKNAYGIRMDVDGTLKNNIISAAPSPGDYYDASYGIYQTAGIVISKYNTFYNNETNYVGTINDKSNDAIASYPRFVSVAGNDYRIYSDSPCHNTADDGNDRGAYAALGVSSGVLTNSYVKPTGNDSDTGTDEAHAWQTIPKALSSTEGTVNVLAGTYTLSSQIKLGPGQYLKSVASPTILATLDASSFANAHAVVMGNNATLEGFTLKCTSNTTGIYGIYVSAPYAGIKNNLINFSGTIADGGCIKVDASGDYVDVQGNTLNGSANSYYVMYLVSGSDYPVIKDNTINQNLTTYNGRGIYMDGSYGSVIQRNTITANRGIAQASACGNMYLEGNKLKALSADINAEYGMKLTGYGTVISNEVRGYVSTTVAGIYTYGGGPFTINKNTVVKNLYGLKTDVDVTVKNNIISAAPVPTDFSSGSIGIYQTAGTVTSAYNDLFNNETNYSGTVLGRSNDIALYPKFADIAGNDYRIYGDSPCAGTADDGGNRGAYGTTGSSLGNISVSYVKPDGNDSDTGTSETHAWKTITRAITSTDSIINVLAGTYNTALGETFPLVLKSNQWLRSVASPSTQAVIQTAGTRAVQMYFLSTVEGFTVKASAGSNTDGAIYASAKGFIMNNYVTCEAADCNGIYLAGDANGSEVSENTVWAAGSSGKGIKVDDLCDDVIIADNTVTAGKYGILLYHRNNNYLVARNKVWAATQSAGYGLKGGDFDVSATYIYNGNFTSNEVRGFLWGAYIKNISGYTINLTNNTIVKNNNGLYLTYYSTGGTFNIKNSIIASEIDGFSAATTTGITRNTSTVNSNYNCLYANDTNYGAGVVYANDIYLDPKFVASEEANDFHLKTGSPCINAGTPEGYEIGCYDYTGSCSITLRSPVGGETWNGHIYKNITWESTGYCGAISLYYSLNSGADYTLIASGEANDGLYQWYVPFIATTEAKVKLIANGVEVVSSESPGTFTIATPPPPSITSIYPTATQNNQTALALTITGEAFQTGVAVKLSKSGESDISASSINVVNITQLDCAFNIQDKKAGTWLLTVTNPDSQYATYEGLTINNAPPAPSSVDPVSGTTVGGTKVTISGSQFLRPDYKRTISISNEGSALSDYQVLVTLNTAALVALGKMRSDCGDVRFYDSDQTTPLSFWLDTGANTSATMFWVKVPTLEAAASKTIYITYGNPELTSASNLGAVFIRTLNNLEGCWSLDETSGANAADSSGNGLNGTATGATIVNGKFGKCRSFNGTTSDYVRITDNAKLKPDQIAFDCWAYLGNWTSDSAARTIISKTQTGDYNININDTTSGYLTSPVYVNGLYRSPTTLLSGLASGWHHLLGNFDGRYARLFVDGVLKNTVDTGGTYNLSHSTVDFYIGAEAGVGGPENKCFNGYIDEVHIFSGPLITAEVEDLAANYGYASSAQPNKLLIRKRAAVEPFSTVSTTEGENITKVFFGDTLATDSLYVNYTTVTATTPAHAAGLVNVTMQNPDGQVATLEGAYTFIAPSNPNPTSIVPNQGPNTGEVSVVIYGTDFKTSGITTVELTRSGTADVVGTSISVVSTSEIHCNFDLTGRVAGAWNVVVANPDTLTGTLANGFTITGPPPTVVSLSPDEGRTAGGTGIAITGTNYQPSDYRREISITNSGSQLDNYQINFTLDTSALISAGKMRSDGGDIRFYDANGTSPLNYFIESGINTASTKIWIKVPTIEAVATKTIFLGYGNPALSSESSGAGVFLSFDDFSNGSIDSQWTVLSGNGSITESDGALNFSYTGSENNDWWSSGRPEKVLQLNSLPSGDFHAQAKVNTFTPNNYSQAGLSVYQNDTSAYIWGRYKDPSYDYYRIEKLGTGNVASDASSTLPMYLAIRRIGSNYSFYLSSNNSSWTKVGSDYSDLTFNNIVLFGKEWGSSDLAFSLDDFRINKYVASPPSVTVAETDTGNVLRVYFNANSATNVTYVNSTTITATAPAHAAGVVSVTVRNPDSAIGTKEAAFTYNAPPTVTSIDPSTGVNTGEVTATVYGTGFKTTGTTSVKLTKTGTADVTATGVSVSSDTQLSATFDLNGKKVGAWNIVVTNPDAQTGTLDNGFNVVYPAPIISRVAPESGSTDGGTLVTIEGTGFVQSYNMRRAVNISNSGSALSDYQVQITADTAALISAGKMKADGGDIRFYDSNGTSSLSYWVESGLNTSATKIWIKVPTIEASSSKTIYLAYGDPELASESSGKATMFIYENMESTPEGTFKNSATYDAVNKWVQLTPALNSQTGQLEYLKNPGDGFAAEYQFWHGGGNGADGHFLYAYHTSSPTWYNQSTGGYFMVYDEYYDRTGLFFNGSQLDSISQSNIDDSNWHDAKILHSGVNTKIYYDGTLKNNYNDTTRSKAGNYFGWGGMTGGLNNIHRIKNLRVRKYTDPEPAATVGFETGNLLRVLLGSYSPASTTYKSSTTIEVLTAPVTGPITVDVTVINPDGQIGTKESAFTFTQPAVRLFSPNGGEVWKAATWHNITWEAINNPSAINLYLLTSEAAGYQSITSEAENDGTYAWLVPNLASTECKVRIEAVSSEGTATDESNSVFTITAATDFYVNAATGDNAYSGLTSDLVAGTNHGPWKTLTYASTAAPTGSTVHAAAGTYNAALGETFPVAITGRKFISDATGLATLDAVSSRLITLSSSGTVEGFSVKTTAADGSNGAVHLTGKGFVIGNIIDNSAGSSGYGIYLVDAADGSQVKNNSIKTGSSSTGLYLNDYTLDIVTEGNTLEVGSNGTGIRYGYGSNNYIIRNNLVKGPGMASGTGIYAYGIYNGTIASNEVRDLLVGIDWSVYDSNYTGSILNNTVIKCASGIYCREYSFAPKYTVKNNVVSASPQLGTYTTSTYGIRKTGSANVTLSYNDIWNNATNYENLTAGTGDIALCPRFISPEASDYRIGTDSPCATGGEGGTYMGRYAPSGISGASSESWVDDDGSDLNDGSEASPLRTIKKALSRTESLVHVKAGTYTAGETFPQVLSTGQQLKSEASPQYLATIEASVSRILSLGPNCTVEGFALKTIAADSSNGVIHGLGKSFVRNNTIDNSAGSNGYGVYLMDAADGSQVKDNSIKTGSSSTGIYLADYCLDASTENNTVEVGSSGTGIRGGYGSNNYNIRKNLIKGPGIGSGTGIYAYGIYTGTIASNEVRDFLAGIDWAVFDSNYTGSILNNTVIKCTSGIYCREYSFAPKYTVKNNIVSASPQLGTFTTGTYGIRKTGSANVTLSFNDIWNNATNYDNLTAGTGDITQYPRFISPEASDYRIGTDSPCATGGESGTYMGRYPASGTSPATSESWVDTVAGDDSHQYGLESAPWKTIKKAIGLTSGTMHVKAGTYSAGETYPLAPSEGQTLRSESIAQKLVTLEASTSRIISLFPNTTIEGFTLKTTAADTSNGVIHCLGKGFIYNNVIDNAAGSNGRGIYLLATSDGSQIKNNYLKTGSSTVGLYADNACDDTLVEGSTFEVGANGYGIYFNQANNIAFRNNKFVGAGNGTGVWANSYNGSMSSNEVRGFNAGVDWGVWNSSYAASIYNNTLIRNTYGLYCRLSYDYWGIFNLKNNIISAYPQLSGYTAGTYGIYKQNASMTVNSTYNDLWNNATDYYLCSAGVGDISKYPRFITPEAHNYYIGTDSPCAAGGEGGTYMGCYPPEGVSSATSESWVDDGGSDSNAGSFDSPWKTITYALTKTDNTTNVMAGIYNKSANNESFPIRLISGQKLLKYGAGYATIEADGASQNQHSVEMTANTTLEGLELVNRSSSNYIYPVYVSGPRVNLKNDRMKYLGSAFYTFAVGVNAAGDYLTIENCTLESDTETTLFFDPAADYPLVKNNTITNNNTSNAGAIRFYGTSISPTIEGNTITTARHGIYEGGGELTNQVVKSNKVIGTGSSTYYGIFLYGPGTVTSNEVRGFKDASGAAIFANYMSSGNLTLDHNTLAKNTIGIKTATTTIVKNSIIASEVGGYAVSGSKGIYQTSGTATSLYNSLYANDATYEGTVGDQTGDLLTDPLFVDAANNNFHLASGSPCISSATPEGDRGAYPYIVSGSPDLVLTRESLVTAPAGYSGGANDAVPGATIKYNIYITNQRAGESKNVVLVDKIPGHTNFKIGTATGEAVNSVEYSNDNGGSYVYAPSGTFVDPAVTNIRWNHANIASGATKKVEFSVVIR